MTIELRADRDRRTGWTLFIDGTPQSYVDTEDPGYLEFEYQRQLASLVDAVAPPGAALRVLHLGGGALTLPRYIAATRPGSSQRVVERDAAVVELVRRELPMPRGANIRVRVADAREVVRSLAASRFDLVVTDVFADGRVPAPFTSVEFAGEVSRLLRAGGRYAVNIADGRPLRFARAQVATLRAVFPDVCLLAEPGVLRGRRYGNLAAAAAREMFPTRLLYGERLEQFVSGTAAVSDATAVPSPPPPPGLFD